VRILLVSNQFYPVVGGIENFLRDYAPALRERGHDVAVLTSQHAAARDRVDEYEGIPVFRGDLEPCLASRDVARIHRSRRWNESVERDWAPDVVHAHDAGPNLWVHLGLRDDERAPTVATIQTSLTGILDPVSIPVTTRLLERCDWVTGVSRAVLEETRMLTPGIDDRSSFVPNGVVIPRDPPTPLPPVPRVLCLGRLVRQKGFDVAIAAMPGVLERFPDATLTIGGDGAERAALARQAEALGIGDRIELLGVVRHRDVAALLDAVTVVAMPSRFEGMPLVWLEAAVRGRPVVATPAQGLGELIEHGRTGLLVPFDDADALADALGGLLEDAALARSLGAAARRLVLERYSLDACVDAYTTLYERVAARRRGPSR